MANPVHVVRFWTAYEPETDPDAIRAGNKVKAVDWVEYGPVGLTNGTATQDKVSRVLKVQPPAPNNPAIGMANAIAATIRDAYDVWKSGREPTEEGTPLAAWPAMQPELATILRGRGVKTIENVAELSDTHIRSFGVPGLRQVIEDAKRFLAALDQTAVADSLAAKDRELDAIREEMEAMRAYIQSLAEADEAGDDEAPRRKRGRPRKAVPEAEADDAADAA